MKSILFTNWFVLSCFFIHAQAQTDLYPGFSGSPLLTGIQQDFTPSSPMSYSQARDSLYLRVELDVNDSLEAIYSGFKIKLDLSTSADPSTDAFNKGINAEHSFPQSFGASFEPAKSDMHSLFPSKTNVNSSRGNCVFLDINDWSVDSWFYQDIQQSSTPAVSIDLYSEKENDGSCAFEPREGKKGDIARAIFYFYCIYNSNNVNNYFTYADDNFFNQSKSTLLAWHYQDPVDLKEYERTLGIEHFQGNKNPFVIDSTLARRMFFESDNGNLSIYETAPYDFAAFRDDSFLIIKNNGDVIKPFRGKVRISDLLGRVIEEKNISFANYARIKLSSYSRMPLTIELVSENFRKTLKVI